jgi:proteasome lid subunit RPN8/RPN11
MEEKNRIFNLICLVIIVITLLSCIYLLIVKFTIIETTINKMIYGSVLEELDDESLKNNIIIDDNVYMSMKEYLQSFYPNESAVTIYGEYNKDTDSFIIFEWKEVDKIYRTNGTSMSYKYSFIVGSNFIGTVHSHPKPNYDNSDCSLSDADVNSYNEGGHLPNEIEGIFCNNYNYMIFFAPTNETSDYFVRYVYKGDKNESKTNL